MTTILILLSAAVLLLGTLCDFMAFEVATGERVGVAAQYGSVANKCRLAAAVIFILALAQ